MAEQIELSEFIRNALVQIANGVKEANRELDPDGNGAPYVLARTLSDTRREGVRFDVSVVVRGADSGRAKLGILAASVGGEMRNEDQQTQRIQFEVSIDTHVRG